MIAHTASNNYAAHRIICEIDRIHHNMVQCVKRTYLYIPHAHILATSLMRSTLTACSVSCKRCTHVFRAFRYAHLGPHYRNNNTRTISIHTKRGPNQKSFAEQIGLASGLNGSFQLVLAAGRNISNSSMCSLIVSVEPLCSFDQRVVCLCFRWHTIIYAINAHSSVRQVNVLYMYVLICRCI